MKKKRLRVFSGPNGSGKSTLFQSFSTKFDVGIFVNADSIEKQLREQSFVNLDDFGVSVEQADLDSFFENERAKSLLEKSKVSSSAIHLKNNILVVRNAGNFGYLGAIIALFIRGEIIKTGKKFSFETVMSHSGKIQEIQEAKSFGYKTYLYFICTDSYSINISRVKNRVSKGGHAVDDKILIERYEKSLLNLVPMLQFVDECYFFDNSKLRYEMIAEIKSNTLQVHVSHKKIPNWFINHVLVHYIN